jgi:hypothetical protein
MPETVCEIVARVMERPSVALEDRLEELGCDELDRVTIGGEVEQQLGLDPASFDEAEIAGWNQVIDIAESVVRAGDRQKAFQAKLERKPKRNPT